MDEREPGGSDFIRSDYHGPEMTMNCQHCQNLLLDHLYGLLEGPDVAAVDAHLATCSACATARAETARVQGLIARAAKSAFPKTRFEAPAPAKTPARTPAPTPAPAGEPAPAPLPFPAQKADTPVKPGRTFRVGTVLPWAVAAAVLLAIPGTVLPVLNLFNRAANASHEAELAKRDADTAATEVAHAKNQTESRLRAAQNRLTDAEQAQTLLMSAWLNEQKKAVQEATARRLIVDVQKPAAIQPGAPNDFLVVLRDTREGWESAGKKLFAEVHAVDATDAVIFSQPLEHGRTVDNRHPLRLPASAWAKVKPNSELFLVVAQVDEKTQTRTELQERVRLAGPVFTTLLTTDKAVYRPGERLFFRSLTLDRVTLRPPTREQVLHYELLRPEGRVVADLNVTGTTDLVRVGNDGRVEPVRLADGQPVRGVGCGEFVLPADLPDGDYTLRLREQRHPAGQPGTLVVPVTRTVKVRAGATENYRKQLGFARASFAPGETVEAWAELKFRDKPVSGVAVNGVAVTVDGVPLTDTQVTKETDANGRVTARFALPEEVLNGDVRLKVTFRTPQGEEAVAERVPVIGQRLTVEFFPECGDTLVAGVPCKVYVRATTPAGQPVDIRGVITDGREVLAKVESLSDKDEPGANRGLATFTFTPRLGSRAWLKLESPAGVYAPILPGVPVPNSAVALMGGPGAAAAKTGFMLPKPEATGVVMSVLDPVTAPGQPIRVQLHSVGRSRTIVVGAYIRGRLGDTQKVTVDPDVPKIVGLLAGADPLSGGRGGVVRITAFEEIDEKQDLKPLAERLVFRKPGEVLNLAFTATTPDLAVPPVPQVGGPVVPVAPPVAQAPPGVSKGIVLPANTLTNLAITATDEKGNPAAAVLWAAIVNSAVAPGAKDRLLPTHFLLAGEVKNPDELEYADFLLTEHPKAGEALDLLLGTQGWRRFAEQSPAAGKLTPLQPGGGFGGAGGGPQGVYLGGFDEKSRLFAQNGQYTTWTEPTPLREHRELTQKYAPRYEAAVKAVAQAKVTLEATRAEASDPRSVTRATETADAARRAAEEKSGRAEAAREPVRQFRSNVWYLAAGLAGLGLCCGLAFAVRPADRFPNGFSTLGSLGLAAFLLVAAGWSDDSRAQAADWSLSSAKLNLPNAQSDPGAVFEPRETITTAQPPSRGSKGGADDMPGMPKPTPKSDGKWDKGDAAPIAGGPPPKTKDGNSGFVPPPNIAIGKNPPEGKFGFPGGLGGGGTLPYPLPPAPPGGPSLPLAPGGIETAHGGSGAPAPVAPITGGKASGTGWEPTRPNGVSAADLASSQEAMLKTIRELRKDRATEEADAVKKATDRARKFAVDRAAPLVGPLDTYLAKNPDAAQHLDKFAARLVRDSVTPVPPLVVREFAAPRPGPADMLATEARDTVLWQPVIVLPADGKTTLAFQLGNASGGYQVLIAGHTADGRLGAIRGLIGVSPAQTTVPFGPAAPGGAVAPGAPVAPPPQQVP